MIYNYYSSELDCNRVTIVGKFEGKFLKIAAARCGLNDNFEKKEGRKIATKRLGENNIIATIKTKKQNGKVFNMVANQISILISNRIIDVYLNKDTED